MLHLRSLPLALAMLTACSGGKPDAARTGADAKATSKDTKEEAKPEAKSDGAAAATGSSEATSPAPAPAPAAAPASDGAPTGPDTQAAKLNPEGCTKPTEGPAAAYMLRAFGAAAGANLELRLDIKSNVMTGEGFKVDSAGIMPETVNHQIDPAKVEPFTKKLEALCLNFAAVAPDAPNAPNGFTRYGVQFEDGSIRWMADTNPGLGSGQVFGKVEREKWLDLNKSWPKYQDAKPVSP